MDRKLDYIVLFITGLILVNHSSCLRHTELNLDLTHLDMEALSHFSLSGQTYQKIQWPHSGNYGLNKDVSDSYKSVGCKHCNSNITQTLR